LSEQKVSVPAGTDFDAYADDYEATLNRGLSVSGESRDYFARRRVAWLAECLAALGSTRPRVVLDNGCGTGSTSPFLLELLEADLVIGVDSSLRSLDTARQRQDPGRTRFLPLDQYRTDGDVDLAYCNGVFHHIAPGDRAATVDYIYRALRPGGLFAFWENNPWNPGTRYVMSRIPFDREAITLPPPEAGRLLSGCGFDILRIDFLFIFPRWLGMLRPLEARLTKFPCGAQYQILCRKPESSHREINGMGLS
jgi:SAM-dependent methyltransferase